MVTHERCHGVGDVEKFLNKAGLHLDQVQIVYGSSGRCGGDYYVFYEVEDKTPARPKLKKVKENFDPIALVTDRNSSVENPGESRDDDIELTPVDRLDGKAAK